MAVSLEDLSLPDELPVLPSGWRYESLGDLVDERGVSYGIVQPGSETTDGVPIVRVNNIRNGRIDTTDMLKVEAEIEAKFLRSRLRGGEVLLTLVGTLGEVAIVPEKLRGWNVARAVGVIPVRRDPGSLWVSICLRTAFIQHCIRTWATTTVQATFNLRDLAKLPIPIPPTDTREAIAAVLGALDDKIELNRRMNTTLEAMARALFQSWFVDFDPVRAKLDGRPPAALDPATAAIFPATFQDSPLGHIPEGWETGSILRQADLLSGGTPKTDVPAYWNGDVPWASAKDVSQCGEAFLVSTERTITTQGVDESSTKVIPANATVVVARGATTGRLTMFGHAMAMNQTCYGLRSKVGAPFALYCNARHFIERLVQGGHGSIFDTITTSTFEATDVLLAPKEILLAFDKQVTPLFRQVHANLHQSRTLATLRDALLPKLLSGELSGELSVADRLVEETT
ncbi:MAG: restriction endonuclease subunit S [Thiobacillus sp.]|nr:restriction endonuclease subunit S [Thiobacillus sp.]